VVWSFASNGTGAGNTATIATGAGDDSVTLTAVGLDRGVPGGNLADQVTPSSVLPYAVFPFSLPKDGSTYDGFASAAVVRPGTGNDGIDIHGKVAATIAVAPGDGQDSVTGFVSGTSHLQLEGVDPATVSATATTQGGQAGTLVSYGAADSVFLSGVTALGDGDIIYTDTSPASGSGNDGSGTDGGSVDWNALAAQVLANLAATGQWFA